MPATCLGAFQRTTAGLKKQEKRGEKGRTGEKEKGKDMKESKNYSEFMGMHSVLPESNSFAVSTRNKHAKERKQGTVCAMCAVGTHRI